MAIGRTTGFFALKNPSTQLAANYKELRYCPLYTANSGIKGTINIAIPYSIITIA
jgi:hypothetical protein